MPSDKFVIRKTHGLLPWKLTTPGGTWFSSHSWEHAIDLVDHLTGHHHADKRRHRGE